MTGEFIYNSLVKYFGDHIIGHFCVNNEWSATSNEHRKKMGAVVIFEKEELLFDLITKGISLESDPVPEVLNSISRVQPAGRQDQPRRIHSARWSATAGRLRT